MRVYFWVLSYLAPYRWKFALVIFCGLFAYMINLVIPQFNQRLIDYVIPTENYILFWFMLGGLVLSIGIMFIAAMGRNLLHRHLHENASKDLQLEMMGKLRQLGFAYFERESAGSTLSLFNNDIPSAQNIFRSHLPLLIEGGIFFLANIALMFIINPKLALVCAPCFMLHYLAGPYLAKRAAKYEEETQRIRPEYERKVYESISALAEVRAYGVQKWDVERAMEDHKDYFQKLFRLIFFRFANLNLRVFTIYIGVAVFFLFGADLASTGSISIGEFVSFGTYYFQAAYQFTSLVNTLAEQSIAMAQVKRLYNFSRLVPEVIEAEKPTSLPLDGIRGEIEFREVTHTYGNSAPVLNKLSLYIKSGERVALVGESGSGKTTIVKLLSRFYDPQSGEILLDGIPLTELSFQHLRGAVGFVFQETYLFGTSVMENIRFGNPDADNDAVISAAKAAHLHDYIMTLPEGYATLVGERGIRLSGGQRQRVAIARMMVKNPAIIVLDEATSALDNVTEREVQLALDTLTAGRTTIAVAHRLSTVMHYDRLLFMERGSIVEQGTYEELMERKGRFYSMEISSQRKDKIG
jgi:ATP-binding cassette subfamily B protein